MSYAALPTCIAAALLMLYWQHLGSVGAAEGAAAEAEKAGEEQSANQKGKSQSQRQ